MASQIGLLWQKQSLTLLLGLAGTLIVVALLRRYVLRRPIDLFAMWSNTRMVVYTAVTGALYFALLVPFKWAVMVPGFTEIRPGVALPLFFSFLFGPAAAWGAGIGNFIGDFFGMLGPSSLFGFFGNFLLAYAPYAIYRAWCGHTLPSKLGIKAPFVIGLALLGGIFSCATFIAWGVHLLGMVPFKILAPLIVINNSVVGLVLALPLILLMLPRIERWGVTYYEVLDPEIARPSKTAKLGSVLFLVGAIGGWLLGMGISVVGSPAAPKAEAAPVAATAPATAPTEGETAAVPTPSAAAPATPADAGSGSSVLPIALGVAPAVLLMIIGILLL
ncbi:MAG: QueT transporter family protein [Myxococcales bacterium]|nr:QueT transporter family protein [Myxococcales bacterium]